MNLGKLEAFCSNELNFQAAADSIPVDTGVNWLKPFLLKCPIELSGMTLE